MTNKKVVADLQKVKKLSETTLILLELIFMRIELLLFRPNYNNHQYNFIFSVGTKYWVGLLRTICWISTL